MSRVPVSNELAKIDKTGLLVSSDYNNLYFSAMAHPDSKWPKIETTKAIDIKASTRLCELFNSEDWKRLKKSRFFKVKYYNPKQIIFQRMSFKENVYNHRKNKYEEINRFRNGDITQYLTSVNIEEVVITSWCFVEILERFISNNLE